VETPFISMPVQFATALVFLLVAVAFVAISVLLPRLFRPINPYSDKLTNYECGERPVGTPWIRFNMRFYIIAILFIIFDVEVLFIIPWAVEFRRLYPEMGLLVFFEMFLFLLILGIGLAYCWVKGHLEWVFRERTAVDVSESRPEPRP